MKITVTTVALNAEKDLPLTIESVLNQDYLDIEYIVLDGLSWDRTYHVLGRYYDKIEKIIRVEDAGIYDAMNTAADIATGEYIIFMNAGDRFYTQDTVSRVIERLHRGTDIAYGDHIFVSQGVDYIKKSAGFSWIRQKLLMGQLDGRWHSRIPGHQATFTKTDVLRQLRYNSRYSICADHEFLLRAHDSGANLQYIDELVARYFAGGMSSLSPSKLQHEWALAYRSYSLRPRNVDRFILGGDSSFPTSHLFSGIFDTYGADVEESDAHSGSSEKFSWVGGLRCISPSTKVVSGLHIRGRCQLAGQKLVWKAGREILAETAVPEGEIDIDVHFKREIDISTEILMVPSRIEPLSTTDGRLASILLRDAYFIPASSCAYSIRLGEPIRVASLLQAESQDLLRAGWSYIETETSQVWSTEPTSIIAVTCEGTPSSIELSTTGNPHTKDAQEVVISLNGHFLGKCFPVAGAFTTFNFEIAREKWRGNEINLIAISCNELVKPPLDTRVLGVALQSILLKN
jgi:glycosyltransferase involved in cell wall biosynthesis